MDEGLKTPGLVYDPRHWAALCHRTKDDLHVPQIISSSAHTRGYRRPLTHPYI
jgi:hypothetical protein